MFARSWVLGTIVGLAINLLSPVAAVASPIGIGLSSVQIFSGNTFTMDLIVSNISDLYAYQFDVSFDKSYLSAASVVEGEYLSAGGVTNFVPGTIDNGTGKIEFIADALQGFVPGVSGSGVLLSIHFQALKPGLSMVAVTNPILLDSNFNFIVPDAVTDGTASIVAEPSSLWMFVAGGALLTIWGQRSAGRRIAKATAGRGVWREASAPIWALNPDRKVSSPRRHTNRKRLI